MDALKCLCLLWVFWGSLAQNKHRETKLIHQEGGFVSLTTGDSYTLRCFFYSDITVSHYWYRQILGQNPRLISTIYKYQAQPKFHNEFINNSRFTIDAAQGTNHLTISDIRPSDSATYYCAYGYSYNFEMAEGLIVDVKDSALNIQASVQQLDSDHVEPGGSVTLNCTVQTGSCEGEHNIYWFKKADQIHSSLIYSHGDKDRRCVKKADTQTRSCVYSLALLNLTESHAGTYYCAVASCGHIVFGNGMKLDFNETDSSVILYIFFGAFTFSSVLLVSLVLVISACGEICATFSEPPTKTCMIDRNKHSLRYAAGKKMMRTSRAQPDETWSECTYFSVK